MHKSSNQSPVVSCSYWVRIMTYLVLALSVWVSCSSERPLSKAAGDGRELLQQQRLAQDDPRYRIVSEKFIDACKMEMLGDYQAALNLFKEVIKLDPSNDAAYFNIAKILYNTRQLIDALLYAEQAVRLNPNNPWYLDLLGTLQGALGNFREAIKTYEQLVRLQPDNTQHWYNWAFFAEQDKQYTLALDIFSRFQERFGITEDITDQKVRLWMQLKKPDRALEELRRLINTDPSQPAYWYRLIEFSLAHQRDAEAYAGLQQLLSRYPDDARAQVLLARYYEQKGLSAQAEETYRKVFSNPALPEDVGVALLVPYLELFQKAQPADEARKAAALRYAALFASSHPYSAKAQALQGDFFYQSNQLDSALAAYQRSLAITSNIFTVWQQMFFIYDQQRRYDSLVAITARCLDYFPDQVLAHYFHGYAHMRLNNHQAAVAAFSRAIALGPADIRFTAQLYALCGDAYHYLKNNVASDSCYERAILYDPNNATALNNYAYFLSLRGEKLERALSMAQQALSLSPENAAYLDTYGWVLYRLGRYQEAKEYLQKALIHGGDSDATILEHFGDVLFQLGDVEQAVLYWQRARERNAESPLLDRKIQDRKLYD
ncbi:MAG: tetratricopeptide repeat protein [Chitinophagales bacterium]|nr:tetratricopeptide repeat protein [Chitinophagales bacterium]MDW8427804.1 tetratricopeptide repeat protein [Chitinophagales bacterium]